MQVNLARAYAQKGDIPKAEEVLRAQLAQEDTPMHGWLGSPEEGSQGSQGSQVPRGTLARLTLGKLLVSTRRFEEALPLLLLAQETQPENHVAAQYLSKVYVALGNMGLARTHIEAAHSLAPLDERVLFDLGMVLLQAGEHELGRGAMVRAERVNPQIDQKLLGRVYLHYGRIDWAAGHFEKALLASEGAGVGAGG
ncbi:hypothetical protein B484DRAFT_435696, partial [Ochromonadaceae sp. CCMP2298]